MLKEKYHLPHNSIRVDEFKHMLFSIDLSREYYSYEELRLLFLRKQIQDDVLKVFHPAYNKNLSNHNIIEIRQLYNKCKCNPSDDNLKKLLNCKYTDRKTFKEVFNETVRDYTEFFAFLGLLPTYYKGKTGGEKKHFVSNRLKDFLNNEISLEELLLDFKYRNSSKDYDSLTMYQISVRPFCVALKALKHYFDLGFSKVDNKIISAIVLYSKNEDITELVSLFDNPTLKIDEYKYLFEANKYDAIKKELGRATLLLSPYLIEMGYVSRHNGFYMKTDKNIDDASFSENVAFCNSYIRNFSLTPVVGKIMYKLYKCSRKGINQIYISELFDENITNDDKEFLLNELKELLCIETFDDESVVISTFKNQYSINPYCDFFDISDSNYVENINMLKLYNDSLTIQTKDIEIENTLEELRPIALGSNGELYEEKLYTLLRDNFDVFDVKWEGANATGRRLSDIYIKTKIFENGTFKNIVIIVECKAGKAIRSFDERKEIDDVTNTLSRTNERIDGVWYWVVDGDSLPSVDEHGGYRSNSLSKSFIEKLNDIQFSVSEYMRVPTIVTAFSFEAIKNYISYLYDKVGVKNNNITSLNKVNVPHFWRWSKKFMNLQYVMVHKELRLGI